MPKHDKTNTITCVATTDYDQPRHVSYLIRVFTVRITKSWAIGYQMIRSGLLDVEGELNPGACATFSWVKKFKIIPEFMILMLICHRNQSQKTEQSRS